MLCLMKSYMYLLYITDVRLLSGSPILYTTDVRLLSGSPILYTTDVRMLSGSLYCTLLM